MSRTTTDPKPCGVRTMLRKEEYEFLMRVSLEADMTISAMLRKVVRKFMRDCNAVARKEAWCVLEKPREISQ